MGEEILDGIPTPTSPQNVTAAVSGIVLRALKTERLKRVIVMLLRGHTWERWLLGPDQPAAADDMVRWMCRQGSPPDAVATVEGALVPVDGKQERLVRVMAGMGACRTERINLMLPKPGKPMEVIPGRWMAREFGKVKDGEGWIGVAPLLAGELESRVIGESRPRGPAALTARCSAGLSMCRSSNRPTEGAVGSLQAAAGALSDAVSESRRT